MAGRIRRLFRRYATHHLRLARTGPALRDPAGLPLGRVERVALQGGLLVVEGQARLAGRAVLRLGGQRRSALLQPGPQGVARFRLALPFALGPARLSLQGPAPIAAFGSAVAGRPGPAAGRPAPASPAPASPIPATPAPGSGCDPAAGPAAGPDGAAGPEAAPPPSGRGPDASLPLLTVALPVPGRGRLALARAALLPGFLWRALQAAPAARQWSHSRDPAARARVKRIFELTSPEARLLGPERLLPLAPAGPMTGPAAAAPVTIVLPVYNAHDLLAECLDRLARHSDLPWRLIAVEDASPDPRIRPLLAGFAATRPAGQVTVLQNPRNLGFIGAVNRGLALAADRAAGGNTTGAAAEPGAGETAGAAGPRAGQRPGPRASPAATPGASPAASRAVGPAVAGAAGPAAEPAAVVLLNSDALVPAGWLSRLLAPLLAAPERVASVTPMSNDAELLSVPVICAATGLRRGEAEAVDALARRLPAAAEPVELPTGVGFCLALNPRFLARIPALDPAFGRGYGEEVDWCRKALALGGQHLAQPRLFVEHRGAASFGTAEKARLLAESGARIAARYPQFDAAVQQFLAEDPLLGPRLALGLALAAARMERVPVWLAHALGGGAEAWLARELAGTVRAGGMAVVLRVGGPRRWRLELHAPAGGAEAPPPGDPAGEAGTAEVAASGAPEGAAVRAAAAGFPAGRSDRPGDAATGAGGRLPRGGTADGAASATDSAGSAGGAAASGAVAGEAPPGIAPGIASGISSGIARAETRRAEAGSGGAAETAAEIAAEAAADPLAAAARVTLADSDDTALVLALLRLLPRRRVIYSCGVGDSDPVELPQLLLALAEGAGQRLEILLHDYFPFSPSHALLGRDGRYHGLPRPPQGPQAADPAHTTLRPDGSRVPLAQWQAAWAALARRADRVVAFSDASAALVLEMWPFLRPAPPAPRADPSPGRPSDPSFGSFSGPSTDLRPGPRPDLHSDLHTGRPADPPAGSLPGPGPGPRPGSPSDRRDDRPPVPPSGPLSGPPLGPPSAPAAAPPGSPFPSTPPSGQLAVVPHRLLHLPPRLPPPPAGVRPVVGVLGNLAPHKGAGVVAALSRLPAARLVLLGEMDPAFRLGPGVRVHGRFRHAELPRLVARYGITGWLIPSVWPETFSFATREALATGLPVWCFDLGAQAEAVRAARAHGALGEMPGGVLPLALAEAPGQLWSRLAGG